MKKLFSALLLPLFIFSTLSLPVTTSAQEAAKSIQPSHKIVTPLINLDVIRMVEAEFTPETIIAQIKSAPSNFVTTPAALQQLREEGVPDAVILAMVMAPQSAPVTDQSTKALEPQKKVSVKIPNGLTIEVESPYTVISQYVKEGDAISFRVVNPVKVDGVTVIEAGATATARVIKASRGGHFGRAGRLSWKMENVTAIDGTRIPLQTSGRIVGDSKGAKVATSMAITAAIMPLIAPVALLHGFKRGENAILPAGKRLEVFAQGEMSVSAPAP
jgi:hypothetical protein